MMLIKDQLYALQSLEYEPNRFFGWVRQNPFRAHLEKKKKLVYTGKARFLLGASTSLATSLLLAAFWASSVPAVLVVILTFFLFPWLYLLTSLFLLKLYEIPNRQKTIRDAQKILTAHSRLTVIGITGSYGKTTVKEMLKSALSKKYKVLSTPKSFNTLFGVSRIIKEQLKPNHEIFIVEMGAYKRGEIAELCRMVKPQIGILTGITNQHLERFGSVENIVKAKYELIEALPANGLGIFNLNSLPCRKLYQQTKLAKMGYSLTDDQAELLATSGRGLSLSDGPFTQFEVKVNSSLLRRDAVMKDVVLHLPGEHNVGNALAAIATALYLNVYPEEIKDALAKTESPEHRLQIINNPDGTIIVDDAYSSNPEGARAAVNLTKKFPNEPKIIVTPGLVELGRAQFEENRNLGSLIAENFDYAVIVNRTNREALLSGFRRHRPGVENSRLFVCDSLEKATKEVIPNLVKPGSLILFENDLPDIYP